jgi:protein-L-isoaspartate(D-aspartate) O-methyltransferase
MDPAARRRFFAEEIEALANLQSVGLVNALATVERERFLRPGPWLVQADADFGFGRPPRVTADRDPARVYHNVAVAIDPSRHLFNGAPSVVAGFIDALAIQRGDRVLHVGCGLGYYSAVMAHCVGPQGRVVAIEVDDSLASEARTNLSSLGWVEARCGTGVELGSESFDAILVNAGMSHPHDTWLRALRPGGRMILPLTTPVQGTIGKGLVLLISSTGRPDALDVRVVALVGIYSAVGIRDESLAARLGAAMGTMLMPGQWPALMALRRDRHEPSASCWLHDETFCLTVDLDRGRAR